MSVPAPTAEFPVTFCAACARDVLCHFELDTDDREVGRCVECAAVVAPTAIRWLPMAELEKSGYGFVLPEGGCGRRDCGNGRCGRSAPDAD